MDKDHRCLDEEIMPCSWVSRGNEGLEARMSIPRGRYERLCASPSRFPMDHNGESEGATYGRSDTGSAHVQRDLGSRDCPRLATGQPKYRIGDRVGGSQIRFRQNGA